MRLYPHNTAITVHDTPGWGQYKVNDQGGFDFPDELSDEMHSFCHRGKRIWETEDERSIRLHGDEQARRRDPQTLYGAVEDIANMARQFGSIQLAAAGAQPDVIAALQAQIAELHARLDAQPLPQPPTAPSPAAGESVPAVAPGAGEDAKPSRSRKAAAS